MGTIFEIPDKELLSSITSTLPCRERQIQALTTLVSQINGASPRNVILYGLEATGKTVITKEVLKQLSIHFSSSTSSDDTNDLKDIFCYAFINSEECIGTRHLFEQIIGSISKALNCQPSTGLLANMSDLVTQTQQLFESWEARKNIEKRFVLVIDGIDKQINPLPQTFPAALARVADIVPNLTIIFITTCPRPSFLHLSGIPHIYFPSYSRSEILTIILHTKPVPSLCTQEDTLQTWTRFTTAVYDSLSKNSGRDIRSFRALCLRMWPHFIRPVLSEELKLNPFSRLLVTNRALFRNESVLVHEISSSRVKTPPNTQVQKYTDIANLLPNFSRLLLIASYLASFSSSRNDAIFFMKASIAKRRKKGGGTALISSRSNISKSRMIPRKLLGAQNFALERMLAIFHAICAESEMGNEGGSIYKEHQILAINGNADLQMSIATLVSLQLLTRVGNQNSLDVLDASTRYRVTIGWDMARIVARSVGVEIENFLND
ncbi:Origin recognition complex subunit 5 [Golovinomyces cichoracearum]|uniref:Origin recognition complex subunit 5 n=1 Tax=Golovinomyces cichoracearum TaxID=62708 RepID=A0A420I6Y4_9PEZI|nr:Origin recognition complex subunit 5 [Golovinomyces cichoracearum]